MAKLSILIEDADYTALKRKALDCNVRFQPWVRDAVLGLLRDRGDIPMVSVAMDMQRSSMQLEYLRQHDRAVYDSICSLVATLYRKAKLNGQFDVSAASDSGRVAREISAELGRTTERVIRNTGDAETDY